MSFSNSNIWKSYKSGKDGLSQHRNAAELLASTLWHLELAHLLGREVWPDGSQFPNETMDEYRRKHCEEQSKDLPWYLWSRQQREPTVKIDQVSSRLSIDYQFDSPIDHSFAYLLQSTLIADAALRLAAAREVLRALRNRPGSPPINPTSPNELDVLYADRELDNLAEQQPNDGLAFLVRVIIAFRDRYMHAEIADKEGTRFQKYRETMHLTLSLHDVYEACLVVWDVLFEACSEYIKTSAAQVGQGDAIPADERTIEISKSAQFAIPAFEYDDPLVRGTLADQRFGNVGAALHLLKLVCDRGLSARQPDRSQRPRHLLHVCSSPTQPAGFGAISRGRMMAAAITNRQSAAKACSIVAKPPRS
ncbi:hypothetical protein [Bradyrhizobium sp.]|uniref:hypothetical protein n=1 Tax=Bradyrhizobium sp. TaxID=376 RepID=UPI001D794B03|nr:hypothetical protein [Bradyrhizobium sp.]MBI5317995.1 hypothetical protein [Bradyrhizobium sp.]